MLLFRYVVLAVLLAAAAYQAWCGARATSWNLHRLRHWKRSTASVYAANDPLLVEVQFGEDRDAPRVKIPRAYDAGYTVWSHVTVLENPARPEERCLTGFFDFWNPLLVAAIFCLAFSAGAWLVGNSSWGEQAIWSGGHWQVAHSLPDAGAPELELREPRESWRANLFFACVLGLPLALPALFVAGGWRPWPAVCACAGIFIFLFLLQSAVLNFTRGIRWTAAGLEEHSAFGQRLVPRQEFGGLQFRDSGAELEKLKPWQDRRRIGIQHVRVWVVLDREEREIFSLPEEMTPPEALAALTRQFARPAASGTR